jgi:hypothetical protein
MSDRQIDILVEEICAAIQPTIERVVREKVSLFVANTPQDYHHQSTQIKFTPVIPSVNIPRAEEHFQAATKWQQQDPNQALFHYTRAIHHHPNFDRAYLHRGYLQEHQFNNLELALADYSKAIEINPHSPDAYFYRAFMQETKLNRQHEAMADYDRVLNIDPNYPHAREYHDRLLASQPSQIVPPQPEHSPLDWILDYNDRDRNFADNYQVTPVDRNVENYRLSMTGSTQDIILNTDLKGKYWLYLDRDNTYLLLPKQKIAITEDELSQFESFFDCNNYSENNYNNFTLKKPATLAILGISGDRMWKLLEKGILQFG